MVGSLTGVEEVPDPGIPRTDEQSLFSLDQKARKIDTAVGQDPGNDSFSLPLGILPRDMTDDCVPVDGPGKGMGRDVDILFSLRIDNKTVSVTMGIQAAGQRF